MSSQTFRVIISGGGVCGLTLANALERGRVEYTLLESRDEIAPALGASIAINANGFRILDQLGCYDHIESKTTPFDYIRTYLPNGRMQRNIDAPMLTHKRLGYPFTFMDRQFLLQTLYDNLRDKSKVLLNKRVSRVEQGYDGVTVYCRDGTSHKGDVVIGADGIHSVVRGEMWRHVNAEHGKLAESERSAMTATYKAIYAISKPTKGFTSGTFNQVLGYGHSMLYTTDKSGRVFWFLFEKMDKKYRYPNIPKFTNDDGENLARRHLHLRLTETLTLSDLWENRIQFNLVPLEEALHEQWTWGRFVCAGDSVHKWTPNLGAGGNHAIESAAALANALHALANLSPRPTLNDIQSALIGYHSQRKHRAKAAFRISNMITRLEALRSRKGQLFALYLQPRLGEWVGNRMSLELIGAEVIKFLPHPQKSLTGTMGFNSNFSNGFPSRLKRRILLALPLILVAILSQSIFSGILSSTSLSSQLVKAVRSGQLEFAETIWKLPTNKWPFNILVTVFAPSLLDIDSSHRLQALTFLIDVNPVWLIWTFESHRRANMINFISVPLIYGIAFQILGIGVVGPIWFFLHYIQSPVHNFAARDWRMINVGASKTALIAILIGLTIPTLSMYLLPDYDQRLAINVAWQTFPITTLTLHHLLRKFTVENTMKTDILWNPESDLPFVRLSIRISAIISALCFNWARWMSAGQFFTILVPQWSTIAAALSSKSIDLNLVDGMSLFLQLDELAFFTAALFWSALLVYDLKREEMVKITWLKALAVGIVGTWMVGPGALVATIWLWREELLARKSLKGAVVARAR